jgi:toxin HigB-1
MIESFRHKGLRRFYEQGDRSKLPSRMTERIGVILAALDVAKSIDDLNRPSFRLHLLKGELKGFWSIPVNANWRIIFRFEERTVLDVDFMDYH